MKNIAMFGGQGSQFIGMGEEIKENPIAINIYEAGFNATGINIWDLSLNSTAEELNKTVNAQLAIFALSLAKYYIAKEENEFASVCGFSLGEITALVAAEVLSVEDGFKLVRKRGEVMQKAADETKGEMYAVLGLTADKVCEICEKTENVYPVNFNTPAQIVISGDPLNLAKIADELKASGAKRVLKLPVSGAFHTPYMANAGKELEEFAKTLTFNAPKLDLYTNITGEKIAEIDVPSHLNTHMTNAVKFVTKVENIVADGHTSYAEFGAKPTLASFVKAINPELKPLV